MSDPSALSGVELTARFLEACGANVTRYPTGDIWYWFYGDTNERPVPDFTSTDPDGSWPHLGRVVKMAREQVGGLHLIWMYPEKNFGVSLGIADCREFIDFNPARALMLAVVRAKEDQGDD